MYASKARSHGGSDSTVLWGYFIVFLSFLWFFVMTFNVFGSKLLSQTGNPLLDFLAKDWYYSMLMVLTIPVTLVAVYLNWLAMKFFRHN